MLSSSEVGNAVSFSYLTIQVNRYCGILIFVIGTIGNVLNILVLSQKTFRGNPCAWLFLMSSIASIISYLSGLVSRFLSSWSLDFSETNGFICKVRAVVVFPAITTTFWLIALATIDRWLLSSADTNRRQKSTIQNAERGTIIMICASFGFYIQVLYCYEPGQLNAPLKCYASTYFCRVLNDISFALLSIFIPLLVMLLFGVMTIFNIRQRHHQVHHHKANIHEIYRKRTDRHLVIMLFFQITTLFILSMPCPMQKLYLAFKSPDPVTGREYPLDVFVFTVSLLSMYLANGLSFYIYTICGGSTFQKGLFDIFHRLRRMIVDI
ncbi:unnamed protein product [Adineta ricciae]|uniref:G-protein coupled receptors family 1 profile domain-containing protein n=1 Tax=Adineta ricciae TaxID=249248 RepID=A0A815SQI1_ADIRI|nr:unnamed protein product [Adineta ricciae]CAF1493197.1 unnamed protein product [Adineta ricciae]